MTTFICFCWCFVIHAPSQPQPRNANGWLGCIFWWYPKHIAMSNVRVASSHIVPMSHAAGQHSSPIPCNVAKWQRAYLSLWLSLVNMKWNSTIPNSVNLWKILNLHWKPLNPRMHNYVGICGEVHGLGSLCPVLTWYCLKLKVFAGSKCTEELRFRAL